MSDEKPTLEIEYPTTWTYKVIGSDETKLRAVATEVVGPRSFQLEHSNASSSGRYVSLTVQVLVEDEAARVQIFQALKASEDVRLVL